MKLFIATACSLAGNNEDLMEVNGASYSVKPHDVFSLDPIPLQVSSFNFKRDSRADLLKALRKAKSFGLPIEDAFDCLNEIYVVEGVMLV